MGLLRYGDPKKFPDTDIMVKRGVKYVLDSTWTGLMPARHREKQLTDTGNVVYTLDRYAPPEEAMQHLHTRGIPELGEKSVHLDGRTTHVWDVWIAAGHVIATKESMLPKKQRDPNYYRAPQKKRGRKPKEK